MAVFFELRGHKDMGMTKPENFGQQTLFWPGVVTSLCICACSAMEKMVMAVEMKPGIPLSLAAGFPKKGKFFKFRTTPTGTLPRDEDLYRTIIEGVPGTSMPAWKDALTPEDTWALINHIKKFSPRFKKETQGEKIVPKTHPESSAELIARGKKVYEEMKCNRCPGDSLKGDGELAESLMDAWKHAVLSTIYQIPSSKGRA
ncbi:MAG: hypothetical protein Ct9H300mP23_03120 [Nitrospinota bacterium]|nr:MAG: hypothetical protein Ct9H300mP23_03120 [Nitrospinota bacterium]